jgi:hypothetical protein
MITDLITLVIALFCSVCGKDTPHTLTDEDGITETYTCDVCGSPVTYAVR